MNYKIITKQVPLILSFISAVLLAVFNYRLGFITNEVSRLKNNNKEAVLEVIENVYDYRTPFTFNYKDVANVRYTYYTCTDPLWNSIDGRKFDLKTIDDDLYNFCGVYDLLAKTRNDFQRKTIKARILGSDELNNALDEIEAGFDDILYYYLEHDYYLRAFPDAYLEVMPSRFDNLVEIARKELRSVN